MKKVVIAGVVIIVLVFSFIGFLHGNNAKPSSPSGAAVSSGMPSGADTYMLLKNVKFRFAEDIFINVHHMLSITEKIKPYPYVDMNNDQSFSLKIISGHCSLEPPVMETLFNKHVFNYKGAPLKDLKLSTVEMDIDGQKVPMLKTSGMMKLVVWLPFEMIARVGVDKPTNRMTLEAYKIKSVGLPFVKNLMDMSGVKLSTLLSIEPGRGLSIEKNTMYVDALNITPPPKLVGKLLDAKVNVSTNSVDLTLGEEKPANVKYTLLVPDAKNFIYIFHGSLIFGKLLALDANLQLVDANPADYLDFYLKKYLLQLSRSAIRMKPDASLIVNIADYQSDSSPAPAKPAEPAKPTSLSKAAPAKAVSTKPVAGKPAKTPAAKPAASAPAVKQHASINLHLEFDTAQSAVKEQYHSHIKKLADLMKKSPDSRVVIQGHTDNLDKFNNPDNNIKLSQARADSVRQYLIDKFGINAARIKAIGYGPNQPIADNATLEGQKKNRRVEAVIQTSPQGMVASTL